VCNAASAASIKRMSDSFTIPKDFITLFTVAFAYHIIQNSKVMSLHDYYNDEAKKTGMGDIVDKYLSNDRLRVMGKKCQGKAKVTFQEPSASECDGIIQVVETFRSVAIESLINRMKAMGNKNMKKKAEELAAKIQNLSTVTLAQLKLLDPTGDVYFEGGGI
jgi:hypothetical protein